MTEPIRNASPRARAICASKMTYASERCAAADAAYHKQHKRGRRARRLRPYRCYVCGLWHLTTKNDRGAS